MKLVMGLGNPGEHYKMHRHNIGFIMIDRLARNIEVELDIRKKKAVYGRIKINKVEFLLLKPLTFMNLAGEAALYIASFMKIKVSDIIVVHDDMDLPLGRFKVKVGGSDGGHNGVKSISDSLRESDFTRIRIGIGRPHRGMEVSDFVLSEFTKEEREKIRVIADDVVDAIKICLFENPTAAMNKYNKRYSEDLEE